MTVDQLLEKAFIKIGMLVLENDLLRDQLNEARQDVERLTPKPDSPSSIATDKSQEE